MDHVTPGVTAEDAPPLAAFRQRLDDFLSRNITDERRARWRRQGHVDRDFWSLFGEAGFLGASLSRRYGGHGGDFRHEVAIIEGLMKHRADGMAVPLHNAVVAPYIARYARGERRHAWLAKAASGELLLAIAMSEPGAGSDLQAIRTTAVRDGDGYRINGQKTFISNGYVSDLVVVACKTDSKSGAKGISLVAVETDRAGFERGRLLGKLGQHARDTAELFFRDVRVPEENLLGEEGRGFAMLMENLPQERMVIACQALAMMEHALSRTLGFIGGLPEQDRGTVRFELAGCVTEARIARVFVDHCVGQLLDGKLDSTTASMAKFWTTEAQARLLDKCLGVFEARGFAGSNPIADLHRDARAYRLYGGTTEIMKTIIGRSLSRP